MNKVLKNPKLIPTQKQQIMMLQQQNALQQRNEQIERELDEMEKELKKKNVLQQRNEQLEKEIKEQERILQETKEKNAENEKNAEKEKNVEKPIYKPYDKTKVVIPTEVKNKLQQLY
jgi:hypothetical protein